MKERPILFSAPMVRSLLNDSKTQTRRVVKPKHLPFVENLTANFLDGKWGERPMPYGQPGDRLWVRETFADLRGTGIEHRPDPSGPLKRYAFAANHPPGSNGDEARKEFGVKWKPSIHMPRAASRITLEITEVRVERLQDISEDDAVSEGATWSFSRSGPRGDLSVKAGFVDLWESINGPGSWEANPWVWVVSFKHLEGSNP
jgi:hypothetical protein